MSAPDRLLVERDRLLGRLAGRGELVQRAPAVEVLDRGDPAGVGVGAQVAPGDEPVERLGELLAGLDPQLRRDVLGPQVHDEALLGPGEHEQDRAVQPGVRHAQVRERLRLGSRLHAHIFPHGADSPRTIAARTFSARKG